MLRSGKNHQGHEPGHEPVTVELSDENRKIVFQKARNGEAGPRHQSSDRTGRSGPGLSTRNGPQVKR